MSHKSLSCWTEIFLSIILFLQSHVITHEAKSDNWHIAIVKINIYSVSHHIFHELSGNPAIDFHRNFSDNLAEYWESLQNEKHSYLDRFQSNMSDLLSLQQRAQQICPIRSRRFRSSSIKQHHCLVAHPSTSSTRDSQ